MENPNQNASIKQEQQLEVLYKWLRMARNKQQEDFQKDMNVKLSLRTSIKCQFIPQKSLSKDLKMLFKILRIPQTNHQSNQLMKIIQQLDENLSLNAPLHNPNKQSNNKAKKEQLCFEDLKKCFIIPEDNKKPKQKQLCQAFKYVVNAANEGRVKLAKKQQDNVGSCWPYSSVRSSKQRMPSLIPKEFLQSEHQSEHKYGDDKLISMDIIEKLFKQEQFDDKSTDIILKQISQWEENGYFNFRDFASQFYEINH